MPPEEQTGTQQQPLAQTHSDGLQAQVPQPAGIMPQSDSQQEQLQSGQEQVARYSGDPAMAGNMAQQPDGAPDSYDFKAPEGQEFDQTFLKVYTDTAKELNLSQENAQKLIDRISPVIEQRQIERIQEIRSNWEQSSRSDREFGGEKLFENLGLANQFLKQHGTPELIDILNKSGLGNHPEIIRIFYRAGKAISPDSVLGGHQPEGRGRGPKSFNDIADKLYAT